ncbi:hypothetical protein V6N13_088789 [Hibiscus sabdariffa]
MFGLLHSVQDWQAISEENLEMERQLKVINKRPIKSFKTDYGDILDCIDIYKQHAFDHPLLKDHKFASVRYGKHNFGAKTRMDVWAPGTLPGQYSMYGIWVASGPFEDLNVIEAGWGGDGHKTTGCFNYLCPGFVQVHREISLGLVLDHISIYNGAQSDIEIGILRVIFSDLLVVKFEVI